MCCGTGRSGLPMPKSMMSTPCPRSRAFSLLTSSNTYGGRRRILWNSDELMGARRARSVRVVRVARRFDFAARFVEEGLRVFDRSPASCARGLACTCWRARPVRSVSIGVQCGGIGVGRGPAGRDFAQARIAFGVGPVRALRRRTCSRSRQGQSPAPRQDQGSTHRSSSWARFRPYLVSYTRARLCATTRSGITIAPIGRIR